MNASNPFPWVKLILINEPIPTHLMNYTSALCPKAMMWNFYWWKLIQLDEMHCGWIKQLDKISCCFKLKYVSSMKMHSKLILYSKFYINSITEYGHNLFRVFLLIIDELSFISLVMEFDDILRWNEFFEEISSMYSYISSTQYNSLIISFPPLNFIHVQWLSIHQISFFMDEMGWKLKMKSFAPSKKKKTGLLMSACWAFPLGAWKFSFQNCLSPFFA